MTRRISQLDDLVICDDEETILVIDNGCDQSIINLNSFVIGYHTGVFFNLGGALKGMAAKPLEVVNNAYTLAVLPSNPPHSFNSNSNSN